MEYKIERYKKIVEMRRRRMLLQEIAAEVGLTKPRIHQIIKQWDKEL